MLFTLINIGFGLYAKHLGGTGNDQLMWVSPASGGSFILAGSIYNNALGSTRGALVKVSQTGDYLWGYDYGRTQAGSINILWHVFQTSDGGYFACGESNDDCWRVRTNPSGAPVGFSFTFGGASTDIATAGAEVIEGNDTNFVIAGHTWSFGAGSGDILVFKINSMGDLLYWAERIGTTGSDYCYSMVKTADGGFALCGSTEGSGGGDALVIKLFGNGSVQWAKAFGGTSPDEWDCIIQTQDGGYAVAGFTWSWGSSADILVAKLSSAGNPLWAKVIGGSGWDGAYSIYQTSDGGFIVSGRTNSFGASNDGIILKLSSAGDLEWATLFGGGQSDHIKSVCPSGQGYFAGGTTQSYGFSGSYDWFYMRIGEGGDYPACVSGCNPSVSAVSLPQTTLSWSPVPVSGTISGPAVSSIPQGYLPEDICAPINVREGGEEGFGTGLRCISKAGALMIISPDSGLITIYSPDGRLVYSGQLREGLNRITLGRGVYLWRAGGCAGKAVVR
jgi:hypothetical protein